MTNQFGHLTMDGLMDVFICIVGMSPIIFGLCISEYVAERLLNTFGITGWDED